MRFLAAVGGFFVGWFLFNLVMDVRWAAFLAGILALAIFFGYGDRDRLV